MKKKRKRCQICNIKVDDIDGHLLFHRPLHCSKCLRITDGHKKTKSSPETTIICSGAHWIPTEFR